MLILNSRKKITVAALFIAGVVLGTLLCGQIIGYSSDKINIYGNFVLRTLKYENISSVNLLKYIAAYRIRELIVIAVISMTYVKSALYGVYAGYVGIRLAVLVSTLTMMNRKMAIPWFLLFNMPHMILYVIAVVWLINTSLDGNREQMIRGRRIGIVKLWVLICFLYILGILSEVFINPVLINLLK